MRLFAKWLTVLVLGVGVVMGAGCGREVAVATLDLNAIGDAQQLEPYVGKRVTLIGYAGLGENRRLATLEGRGVVILTDVEKIWPETMAPRLIEVTGELGIEKIDADQVPTESRGFSLRYSQVVRWDDV